MHELFWLTSKSLMQLEIFPWITSYLFMFIAICPVAHAIKIELQFRIVN